MPAYWWVNHKQTFEAEVGGGYLWSPKTSKGGRASPFYDNMPKVRPGDIVFSYADAAIRAVGVATAVATSSARPPEFGDVGEQWDIDGWHVPVEFRLVDTPLRTMDHAETLQPVLPSKYSPIQDSGKGNQGAYLSAVPAEMASVVLSLLGEATPQEVVEEAAELVINNRTDIPATQKLALVNARLGQGVYRSNLMQYENSCRLTGVAEPRFLVASHIKPWAKSTDFEKLDGSNGLLLAPHVDRLFDRGYISFLTDGSLLVSSKMPNDVMAAWHLGSGYQPKPFGEAQAKYLLFHRELHVQKTLVKMAT